LNCDHCATLVEQEQDFRRDFCTAARELAAAAEPVKARLPWSGWSTFAPAMAAAAAIAVAVVFIPTFHKPNAGPQTVNLSAYRGTDRVTASAGTPLVLRLDTTGLDLDTRAEVRIVDTEGREVWRETPRADGNYGVVNVTRRLDRGVYWVRLVRQGDPSPQREFQLDIR